jgi:hypothetical protein
LSGYFFIFGAQDLRRALSHGGPHPSASDSRSLFRFSSSVPRTCGSLSLPRRSAPFYTIGQNLSEGRNIFASGSPFPKRSRDQRRGGNWNLLKTILARAASHAPRRPSRQEGREAVIHRAEGIFSSVGGQYFASKTCRRLLNAGRSCVRE